MMIYKVKGAIRWMLYQSRLGVTYDEYKDPEDVGYLGSYDHFGRCIAFRKLDGSIQFVWY